MKFMVRRLSAVAIAGIGLAVGGCATAPQGPYIPSDEIDRASLETQVMGVKDYQLVAADLSEKMLKRGLPKGYVVALGPVDTRGTPYSVDAVMLQERLVAILDEEGTLKFTSAVDANSGNSAVQELYKLIEYNWWHSHPEDVEDLQRFGKLAKVNGLIFGRVSSIERGNEITYTFSWRLTNTETGEDVVRLVYDLRKVIRH